jgi:multicomponent Na+:H+ antiporter subunit D
MFVGVSMALVQHDVKRLMAYHAVSQTGYMLLGVGVGIVVYMNFDGGEAFDSYGRTAMVGGIFHIINHAFYKGLLFLTAGVMVLRFGSRNLDKMIGLAHRDTFTTVCFIIGAMAIAGIPPFNGFASKILLYDSVYRFSPILAVIAMFVSVLTLGSFIKVFYSAFLGPRREDLLVNTEPLPVGMTFGMGILSFLVVLMGLFPDTVIKLLIDPAVMSLVLAR